MPCFLCVDFFVNFYAFGCFLLESFRNTGLHKLVFMGDILPEGTEVAYYVGGKVLILTFLFS